MRLSVQHTKRNELSISEGVSVMGVKNLTFRVSEKDVDRVNPDGVGKDHLPASKFMLDYVIRAHEYKNDLRAVECERRKRFNEYLQRENPEIKNLLEEAELAQSRVDDAYEAAKEDRVERRSSLFSDELLVAIEKARSQRVAAWEALKAVRDPEIKRFKTVQKLYDEQYLPSNYGDLPPRGENGKEPFKAAKMQAMVSDGLGWEAEAIDARKILNTIKFAGLGSGTRGIVNRSCEKIGKGRSPDAMPFMFRGMFGVQMTQGNKTTLRRIFGGYAANVKIGVLCGDAIRPCLDSDPVVSSYGKTNAELRDDAYKASCAVEQKKGIVIRGKSKWAQFRIVTIKLGGTDGAVINLPVIFHRPLNPDAIISTVAVHASSVGGVLKYQLILTVSMADHESFEGGTVCVSLGAHIVNQEAERNLMSLQAHGVGGDLEEGDLRVGVLLASMDHFEGMESGKAFDEYIEQNVSQTNVNSFSPIAVDAWGDSSVICEMFIPRRPVRVKIGDDYVERQMSCVKIEADRKARIDRDHNVAKDVLKDLREAKGVSVPEWFVEHTKTSCQWRSPGRMVTLLHKWSNHRFNGDEESFERLQKWKGRHTTARYDLARFRVRYENNRDDFYRRIAKRLAEKYEFCVVEKVDWQKLMSSSDELEGKGRKQRRAKGDADSASAKADVAKKIRIDKARRNLLKVSSPYRFQTFLKEAFGGHRFREVNISGPQKCCRCGAKALIGKGNVVVCSESCSDTVVDVFASSVLNLARTVKEKAVML